MSQAGSLLPSEFADLEPYAADWVLPTEAQRNAFRIRRSMEELDAFHNAVFPRLDALCDYIDQFPLDAMPAPAARLLRLGQMVMEIMPATMVYRQPDVPNSVAPEEMRIISPDDPIRIVED